MAEQDFKIFFFGPIRLGDIYFIDDIKKLIENLYNIYL